MSQELKELWSATWLGLDIECCTNTTQDCEVFVESETALLETVPLTEELMQNEVLKGARDFGTKDFVVLKDKGVVVATWDEFKALTELSTVLEGKQGTEAALSLFLYDEIESVVTVIEPTQAGSDE